MKIFTVYCQSIVFTVNIEHIHMQQKHACMHTEKRKGKKKMQTNILELHEQFKITFGVCVCLWAHH